MSEYPSRVSTRILTTMVATAILALAAVCSLGQAAREPSGPVPERHIVIVVWDGMRPDLVTPHNAPTLTRLAREGVTFRRHHAVYLSATHVNGTAMETGMYPGH